MSAKTLMTLIVLFILINAGLFLLLNKDNFLKKEVPQTYNQISQDFSSPASITLPVDQTHKGVSSAVLIYTFSGKLTKVEPVSSNYRWTLDISDNSIPEFLVNDNTTIVRSRDENLTKVNLSSVKIGANVAIGMIYDLRTKTWNLNTVTITPNK